jgi:putative PIG3 family NAD(P)H quinone oxidoreductase
MPRKLSRSLIRPAIAKRAGAPHRTTMKAVLVADDPDRTLAVGEAPMPELLPDHVLMKVHATAVNRADLLQRHGLYPPPPGESPILGLEAAGQVAAKTDGAKGWRVGDRVMALLGGGGYAEFAAVHKDMLLAIPPQLSFEEAAAIPEAFYTAFVNLFLEAGLAKGEYVLIHAGGSGVGTAAIQLARERKTRVFITAGSEDKIARCKDLGAEAGINYKTQDFATRLGELTGGDGIDVALDCIGASYLAQHVRVLRTRGRLVIIGLMGGTHTEIDLAATVRKRLRVIGSVLRSRSLKEKIAITRDFKAEVLPLFTKQVLKPIVDSVFPLAEVEKAHERVAANLNFGKVVLKID